MTAYEIATLSTNVAIGLGQIAIIWYGIRAMTRSTRDRADEHDKRHTVAMTAQDKHHAEAMTTQDKRHAEAMAAQDKHHAEAMTIQDKRHTEAMAAQDKRHAETMTALDLQRKALETLIARTGQGQAQPAT